MRMFARKTLASLLMAAFLTPMSPAGYAADVQSSMKGVAGQLMSNMLATTMGIDGKADPRSEYDMTREELLQSVQAQALFESVSDSVQEATVGSNDASREKYVRRSFKEILALFGDGVYNPYDKKQAKAQKARLARIKAKTRRAEHLSEADKAELVAALTPFLRYEELYARYYEKGGEGILPGVLLKKNPAWAPGRPGVVAAIGREGNTVTVPPNSKVTVKAQGFCLDYGRPAPRKREPMRLVPDHRLVADELRGLYADLGKWAAVHPEDHRKVQVLLWGLRHAGTETPYLLKLSEEQCNLLDKVTPAGCLLYQAYLDLKLKDFKATKERISAFNALGSLIGKTTGIPVPAPTATGHSDMDVGRVLEGLGRLPVDGKINESVKYTPLANGVVAKTTDTSGMASSLEVTLVNTSNAPYTLDAEKVVAQAGPNRVTQRLKIAGFEPVAGLSRSTPETCSEQERSFIAEQARYERRTSQAALCAGKSYLPPIPGYTRSGPVSPGCRQTLAEELTRSPTPEEFAVTRENRELLGELAKDGRKFIADKTVEGASDLTKRWAKRKLASSAMGDLVEAVPFLGSALSAAEVCTGRDWLWGDRMADIERAAAAVGMIPGEKLAALGLKRVADGVVLASGAVEIAWSNTSKYLMEEGSVMASNLSGGQVRPLQFTPDTVPSWCPAPVANVFGKIADGTSWVTRGLMKQAQGDDSDGLLGEQYMAMEKDRADPVEERIQADLKQCGS